MDYLSNNNLAYLSDDNVYQSTFGIVENIEKNDDYDFSQDLEAAIDQIGGHRKETEEMRRKRLI